MFEKVFVINLKKREDRKQFMMEELKKLNIHEDLVEYFPAFDHTGFDNVSKRAAGCSKSHMFVWKKAFKQKYKSVLILEDDLKFTVEADEFHSLINELYTKYPSFDVCNLAYLGSGKKLCNNFFNSNGIQTASAYIINPIYMNTLFDEMWSSVVNLMDGKNYHDNAIDQVWKKYQRQNDNWLLMKRIAYQRKCFSSILQEEVDYKV